MNKDSYLKKGIALYFANYFDLKKEKNKLYKYFSLIDSDRNGLIFFDEFVEAYHFKVLSIFKLIKVFKESCSYRSSKNL